jgi:hypothetical protein
LHEVGEGRNLEEAAMTEIPEFADNSDDEAIRHRAYMIWLAEGRPYGRADEHWHKAVADTQRETQEEERLRTSEQRAADKPSRSSKKNPS